MKLDSLVLNWMHLTTGVYQIIEMLAAQLHSIGMLLQIWKKNKLFGNNNNIDLHNTLENKWKQFQNAL